MQDRTTHDHRLVARLQQRHRHKLHAESFDRHELVAVYFRTRIACAKHDRNVWSINIRIHQADARAVECKRDGEVNGDGRLTHAALSRRNGDDVSHTFDHNFLTKAAAFRHFGVHRHIDGLDTRQTTDDLARCAFHLSLYRTSGSR